MALPSLFVLFVGGFLRLLWLDCRLQKNKVCLQQEKRQSTLLESSCCSLIPQDLEGVVSLTNLGGLIITQKDKQL